MSQHYDNPLVVTYKFPAASLSAAAVFGRIIGPKGKEGRIQAAMVIVTTGVTVAATNVEVGPAGGTENANLEMAVPISAANAGHAATKAEIEAGAKLDADTVHEVSTDGAATAGAGDVYIVVGWW